jgi:hypothetical protein
VEAVPSGLSLTPLTPGLQVCGFIPVPTTDQVQGEHINLKLIKRNLVHKELSKMQNRQGREGTVNLNDF